MSFLKNVSCNLAGADSKKQNCRQQNQSHIKCLIAKRSINVSRSLVVADYSIITAGSGSGLTKNKQITVLYFL